MDASGHATAVIITRVYCVSDMHHDLQGYMYLYAASVDEHNADSCFELRLGAEIAGRFFLVDSVLLHVSRCGKVPQLEGTKHCTCGF